MKTLTTTEIKSLEDKIYDKLMENPEMGFGEMGECRDEAKRIVEEWMEENNIEEEKSIQCSKVLQLMDEDFTYQKALNTVLAMYPEIDKITLEKELNNYI